MPVVVKSVKAQELSHGHFEPWKFSILDVENLRPHYAKILECWLERFEDSANEISGMFGPKFVRTWRLYLTGAIAGFRVGTLQLLQIVIARTACERVPPTRAHLYMEGRRGGQETSKASTSPLTHVWLAKG